MQIEMSEEDFFKLRMLVDSRVHSAKKYLDDSINSKFWHDELTHAQHLQQALNRALSEWQQQKLTEAKDDNGHVVLQGRSGRPWWKRQPRPE